MKRTPARLLVVPLLALVLLLVVGRAAAELYTDVLWFNELGFTNVLWTEIRARIVVRGLTALLGACVVLANLWVVARHLGPVHLRRRYGNLEISEQVPRRFIVTGIAVIALLAGWWLSGLLFPDQVTRGVLAWLNSVPWGTRDPVFMQDAAFFVFALPVYTQFVDFLLLVAVWSFVLAVIGYVLVGAVRLRDNRLEIDEHPRLHFAVLVAGIVLLFGARYWLGRYGILLEGSGFAGGVGYTDVQARLPAQRVLAVMSIGVAGALLYGAWRRVLWPVLTALGLLLVAAVALGSLYPSLVQKLRVEPNQLERERLYVRWNIEFTRQAYDLAVIERKPFAYRAGPPANWTDIGATIQRLPIWDPEQLRTSFNALQGLYDYYRFNNVRQDRYGPPGAQQQVAIAVREFSPAELQPAQRNWRTLHLDAKLVRGWGVVVAPVAQKTPSGDPGFWIKDVSPILRDASAPADVNLTDPSVYFGETMSDFLVLNPEALENGGAVEATDMPGVPLSSYARVLAFAWRFGDRSLPFASELDQDSRLIFRRTISERLRTLAPFIVWDSEPTPVLSGGHVVWIVDGYSATTMFPIAKKVQLGQGPEYRYVQNSVKATVDGVSGAVTFYALREDEPVLATWRRVFPDMIHSLERMPADLRAHLTYPQAYAMLQADVWKSFHVSDVDAFFTGRNEWQVPGDVAAAGQQSVPRPVYMFARAPGENAVEYWAVVPFIARERQNMTAILLVRNGPQRYGEKLLLELPRDQQVPGPTQVRSLIEQDPTISAQLSLWRSGGSSVETSRIRVVPLDSSFLFAESLFLVAQQDEARPQVRFVVVSDGTNVNMAETMAQAVEGLYGNDARPARDTTGTAPTDPNWASEALRLLDEAERRLRSGDWAGFGALWDRLQETLRQAARERTNR